MKCIISIALIVCCALCISFMPTKSVEEYKADMVEIMEVVRPHMKTEMGPAFILISIENTVDHGEYDIDYMVVMVTDGSATSVFTAMKEIELDNDVCDQYRDGIVYNARTGEWTINVEHKMIFRNEYVTTKVGPGSVTGPRIDELEPVEVWDEVLDHFRTLYASSAI